ncbi:hypothetical protein TNCV_3684221 [Trichonephila clavipes]|uniref:Mutator-like transposase domain-containing protein n=1 Tax=Trichonephila clavipes TaxID=2585209 RepID=A0A8X6RRW9_TRICX|nr:hypothetical protein TNCV_3684221 [Trichonephila clavipes]
MEVSGAIEIFQFSESLHGLRYTKFLEDGDSKAYKTVNEWRPYGNTDIERMECVGHVEKRMETRIRVLKLKMKDKMLTKYQMIKFIDFREVWFLPESVARVAAIIGDHYCYTPWH